MIVAHRRGERRTNTTRNPTDSLLTCSDRDLTNKDKVKYESSMAEDNR